MTTSSNGGLSKIVAGVFGSLVVALITGFGMSVENGVRQVQRELYKNNELIVELREKLSFVRDRQKENEVKIESSRAAIDEIRMLLNGSIKKP